MRNLCFFILISLISFKTYAIGFEDGIYPELITSARGLAMGNAFISKVDDSNSAFYNPAGLGTVRNSHFHLFNVHLETNDDFLEVAGDGSGADSVASNLGKSFKMDGLRQLLVNNKGKMTHSRVHTFPNLTFRFFTVGYMVSKRTRTTIEDTVGAQFEYADRFDHGPVLAANFSLWGGVFKLGATATFLNRTEAIGTAPADRTFELADEQYNKGHMAHITAGAKLTLPIALLPTLSGTLRNAGGTGFTHDGGPEAPGKIRQTADVGFSLTPYLGKNSRFHMEVNMKDTGNQYESAAKRRVCVGAELDIVRTLFFRGGYGDSFGSAGLGLRVKGVELDITTYAVDTSTATFRGKEDRRYVFSLSAGF